MIYTFIIRWADFLVVSWQSFLSLVEKGKASSYAPFADKNLVSQIRFGCIVPCQPGHSHQASTLSFPLSATVSTRTIGHPPVSFMNAFTVIIKPNDCNRRPTRPAFALLVCSACPLRTVVFGLSENVLLSTPTLFCWNSSHFSFNLIQRSLDSFSSLFVMDL